MIFLVFSSVAANNLKDELLYYYEFNDATDSHGSADLNTTGSVTYGAGSGKVGDGLDIDEDEYLYTTGYTLPHANSTYNIWVQLNSLPDSNGEFRAIFSRISTASYANPIEIRWEYSSGGTDTLATNWADGASPTMGNSYAREMDTTTWHMMTFLRNGTSVQTYFDGSLVDTDTLADTTGDDTARDLRIGQWQYPAALDTVNGDAYFDEFGIWNRTLTTTDIANLYNSGSGLAYSSFTGGGAAGGTDFLITARNGYNLSSITNFNATINGTYYGTTTGTINTTIPSNSTYLWNITVWAPGYINATYLEYNVSSDLVADLYPVNTTLNVSAYSNTEASLIQNFTATILGLTDGHTVTLNTTNGTIHFTVRNQTYNVSIDAPGYADNYGNSALVGNWSAMLTNYQFNLYTTNSFNITFKDESSLAIINTTTINLDLISEVFSSNYSTSTGTLYIDLLTPATYTFRYSGSGFQPRLSSYTLDPSSYNEIILWLLPGGENVTIFVYDQSSDPVEGATIQIYRYSSQSNSYFLVNTIDTDFTGQAVTNLELNSEFYKFFIYYEGELKKQTAGAYVTGTELTFEINTEDPIAQTYYSLQDVDGYVSFNENTNNFRFYFNDQGTTVSQGCLKVYTVAIAGETLFNTTCVSGSSALILVTATNVSGQRYVGSGYVTIGGKEYLFDTYSYTFKADSSYGGLGVLLVIFLTILAGTLMLWDISVSLMLLPLPTLIGSLPAFNWINVPTEYAVGLEVMMVVLAFLMKKKPF